MATDAERQAYREKLKNLLIRADELDLSVQRSVRQLLGRMRDEIIERTREVQDEVGTNGRPGWGPFWMGALARAHNAVVDKIADQFQKDLRRYTVKAYEEGSHFADESLKFVAPKLAVDMLPRIDPEQLKIASDFPVDLITNMKADQKKAIAKEVALVTTLGGSPAQLITRLREPLDTKKGPWVYSHYRAEVIARTEVARIQELGREQRMQQQQRGNPGTTLYKQFLCAEIIVVRTGKKWPCRVCGQYEGYIYTADGQPHIPRNAPPCPDVPVHPNCFIDGTPVLPVGKVEAAYRRFYEGPVTELFLGDSVPYLTVTPNHPILTQRGWVPAGEIDESDSLVYCPDLESASSPTTVGDVEHPYVRIEEVFQTLAQANLVQRVPGLAMQFHGDGQTGEVQVVRSDLDLAQQAYSSVLHLLEKPSLCLTHAREVSLPGLGSIFATGDRPGSSGSLATILQAHLRLAEAVGGTPASNLDPCPFERPSDARSAQAHGLGDGEFRHPLFDVKADDLPGEVGKLLQAGLAYLLPLRKVRIRDFSGHVNNLQTRSGFYSAAGIPSRNCRCTWIPWVPGLSPEPRLEQEQPRNAGKAYAEWNSKAVGWELKFPSGASVLLDLDHNASADDLERRANEIALAQGHDYDELEIERVNMKAGQLSSRLRSKLGL